MIQKEMLNYELMTIEEITADQEEIDQIILLLKAKQAEGVQVKKRKRAADKLNGINYRKFVKQAQAEERRRAKLTQEQRDQEDYDIEMERLLELDSYLD